MSLIKIDLTKLNKILGINKTGYIHVNSKELDMTGQTYNWNTLGIEPWNKGKKDSKEHKQAKRDAKKKSPVWNKGKKGLQKSTRKGVPRSEETKKRIAEATRIGMKKYYENRKSN
tara:strand:+ start:21 stop:365 length:345 start_codon:yes stop_codon:yes gene_type:complete